MIALILRTKEVPLKTSTTGKPKIILVKDVQKVLIPVSLDNIISIEINKESLSIRTTEGKILTSKTLKEAEELLLGNGEFIKIHRSYIIAIKFIKGIEDKTVKMKNDQIIPIGETYRGPFINAIEEVYKF